MGCCTNGSRYRHHGIGHNRSCTDVICLIIFLLFIGGMGLIMVLAYMDDGLDRVINGYDSFGNVCNQKNKIKNASIDYNGYDTTNLKYVLFFDYLNPKDSLKACVRECPSRMILTKSDFQFYTRTNGTLCLYNVSDGVYRDRLCPKLPIFQSANLFNRCIPLIHELALNNSDILRNLLKYLNEEWLSTAINELYNQKENIGYLSLISLAISFALVFLIRFVAKLMVILILCLSCASFIALTSFLWYKYYIILQTNIITTTQIPLVGIEITTETAYLSYSIATTVLTLVFLLVIVIMRKRIELVVKLFAEAQRVLVDIPMLLFMPMFTFVILIIFIAYWLFSSMLLASFGKYQIIQTEHSWFKSFNIETYLPFLWLYQVFGLFWISEFIFACQALVVSGCVAIWYFKRDKTRRQLGCPILRSIKRLIVFHLGTAAFGGLIIALVKFPRYVLKYLHKKTQASSPNTCLSYLAKCCMCCLWFLEKFLKFINYNAYTIVNIEGKSFCVSSKKAFTLIVENSFRVAALNSVGDFMLFLAKLTVTALTLLASLVLFKVPIDDDLSQLKFHLLPLLIVSLISYLIAHCFFTIFEMVIDSLLVCFCEDCKLNDGSVERPYFMSKSLKEFIDDASSVHLVKN